MNGMICGPVLAATKAASLPAMPWAKAGVDISRAKPRAAMARGNGGEPSFGNEKRIRVSPCRICRPDARSNLGSERLTLVYVSANLGPHAEIGRAHVWTPV